PNPNGATTEAPSTEEKPASEPAAGTPAADAEKKPAPPGAVELKPVTTNGYQLNGTFKGDTFGIPGRVNVTLTVVADGDKSSLNGHVSLPDGERVAVTGGRWPEDKKKEEKKESEKGEEEKPDDEKKEAKAEEKAADQKEEEKSDDKGEKKETKKASET